MAWTSLHTFSTSSARSKQVKSRLAAEGVHAPTTKAAHITTHTHAAGNTLGIHTCSMLWHRTYSRQAVSPVVTAWSASSEHHARAVTAPKWFRLYIHLMPAFLIGSPVGSLSQLKQAAASPDIVLCWAAPAARPLLCVCHTSM